MTDRTPETDRTGQPDTPAPRSRRTAADTLRYVPPVAALGTAFVMQVLVITDTVGSGLADRYHAMWPYIPALLLGLSVASCAEGGAAYLMDLYDKHLLAGDSVWMLRLSMVVYVAASGVVIHWWTGHRGLPEVITWLLAGMSASALFLWSRGSRWRRREAMRAKGLIDDAMPRLATGSKIMHPVRWLVTLYLISWEPARTPAEARARYDQWRTGRTPAEIAPADTVPDSPADMAPEPASGQVDEPVRTPRALTVRPAVPDTARNVVRLSDASRRRTAAEPAAQPSIDQLADTLGRRAHGQRVGKPKALAILREVYGSCSADRAIAAKDLHNERVARAGREPADDKEEARTA